jgi:peptide/nickel transport system permease protein
MTRVGPTVRNRKNSQFLEAWNRLKRNKLAMLALVIVVAMVLASIFANLFFSYDKDALGASLADRLQTPNVKHWFGTDHYGRDLLARILYGGRISLLIGFGSTGVATLIAAMLGPCAAYFGGKVDSIIMRCVDVIISIPGILLTVALVAGFGVGVWQLMVAIAIPQIAGFTRIFRSAVLVITKQEYIEAARALGANDRYIITRHVIPNILGTILVQFSMYVAGSILTGAGLSFLGLGAQIPTPEWGAMLNEGMAYIPGVMLVVIALSVNVFGDGLRDAFDPKLKGRS